LARVQSAYKYVKKGSETQTADVYVKTNVKCK